MKKIKVLLLTVSLHNSGPAKAIFNIATHINRERFDVVVCQCQSRNRGFVLDALRELKIPVNKLDMKGPFDLRAFFRLFTLLREENIDIVHTRLIRADFYGRIAGKIARIPLIISNQVDIYTEHFKSYHGKLMGSIWYRLDKVTLRLTDLFVTNSDGVTANLVQNVGVPRYRVVKVYNGIHSNQYLRNPKARLAVRKCLGIQSDNLVVGCVARLHPKKGIIYLVEAAKLVLNDLPYIKFVIVGDGPERAKLEKRAQQLELTDDVLFLGERNDIPELLSAMDVFAFPSLFEGHPNSVLEAMAASLPVVASDILGNNELVQDGVTGYLVPKADPDKLANRIIELVEKPDLMATFGLAGRKIVETHFSINRMINEFESVYETYFSLKKG